MNGSDTKSDLVRLETRFENFEGKLDEIQKTLKEIALNLNGQALDVELLKKDVKLLQFNYEKLKEDVKKNTSARWQATGVAGVVSFLLWFFMNFIWDKLK